MNNPVLRFLFLTVAVIGLSNCAPTMHIQTEGNATGALNKSALHYIMPPAASDSPEVKNLYPVVVNAFQNNHIALTKNRKDAAFVVTWGVESQSKQTHTYTVINGTSDWNSTLNQNSSYGGTGMSATGPQYVPMVRTYQVENFSIHVWKNEPGASNASTPIWNGNASIGSKDMVNTAPIVDNIVARYGTNYQGNSQLQN